MKTGVKISRKEPTDRAGLEKENHEQFFFQKNEQVPALRNQAQVKPFAAVTNPVVQRKCNACEQEEQVQKKETAGAQTMTAVTTSPPPPPGKELTQDKPQAISTPARFVVDNQVIPETGQMKKNIFLARLKTEVCDTVNQALSGTPYTSDNCPYIQASFARHEHSTPAQLEALIIRYCPAAAKAKNADEMIEQMKAKVYHSALQWAKNGKDGSGAANIFGGMMGLAGGLMFKENTGGAVQTQSPVSVMHSLGKGSAIEGSTRSKMETAFGSSFSDVEIHTDAHAGQLSQGMNARAFTVGNHIAFAPGEHQPGTLIGDALLAHELAHTLQQSNGESGNTQMKGGENHSGLEDEADQAAVGAVVSKWSDHQVEASDIPKRAMPKLKTGLKLQACRRTVKQCPRGLRWSVVGLPTATGPVCVCTWRCLPPGVGYSVASYSGGGGGQTSVTCANKDRRGRCPGEPDYENVDSDYEIKDDRPGTVIGVGAHMSPLGGQAACGCLPLDIEGDASGEQQVNAPLLPPGVSLTDFAAGMGVKGSKSKAPPPTKDPKPPAAISQPLVPKTTPPPVTKAPPAIPAVKPPAATPPVTTAPPAVKAPPTPAPVSPPVAGKPPAPVVKPPEPLPAQAPVVKTPPASTTGTPAPAATVTPAPAPVKPGPIAAGESLSVPYKGSTARATVLEAGIEFVKILVRSKSRSGDITQSIPRAKFDEMLKSKQIIRWSQEREALMRTRPTYEDGLVELVWQRAVKASPDGIVRDPNTKEVLTWNKGANRFDQWHMGHKKGAKYSDLVDSYIDGKITFADFLKEYNNANNYRPEAPGPNMSHAWE